MDTLFVPFAYMGFDYGARTGVVAAPSKIPRASGDKVKTDARDAELIARLLLAGKLHQVRVPGPEEEAVA